jgi:hypothetical protein
MSEQLRIANRETFNDISKYHHSIFLDENYGNCETLLEDRRFLG